MASLVASSQHSLLECLGFFFSLTCFLAAVKPGQACQKNDIVLEIHFPYLEMKPAAIYISEPHSSSEQFHPELSLWS